MAPDVDHLLEDLQAARAGGRPRHEPLWRVERSSEPIDALRGVRRTGPGQFRRVALDALLYLAGPEALDSVDVAAVQRLIQNRQRTDQPAPVVSCWTYWWCIRSSEQNDVMTELGLTERRPVTYPLANSIMDILEHHHRESRLVYIGPSVNGWTPVAGPRCNVFGEDQSDARATVQRLSARFGETHAFYFGAQGDGSAWLIARDGTVIRCFSTVNPDQTTGEPLPVERDWMTQHGIPGRPEDHLAEHGEHTDAMWQFPEANEIAAAISLDIGWHHPSDGHRQGTPTIALMPGTGPAHLPPGAYEI